MMASTVDGMPGEQWTWVPLPTLGLDLNLPARLVPVAAYSSADRAMFASQTEGLDVAIDRNLPGDAQAGAWHSVLDALAFARSWRDLHRTEPTPYVMAGCAGWYGTFAYSEPSGDRVAGALWAKRTGYGSLSIAYRCDAAQSETVTPTSMAILASAHLIGTATATVPSPTTISCPQCGAWNRVGSSFCYQCAAPIVAPPTDPRRATEAWEVVDVRNQPPPFPQYQNVPPNQPPPFPQYHGAPNGMPPPVARTTAPRRYTRRAMLTGIGGLVLAAGGTGGAIIAGQRGSGSGNTPPPTEPPARPTATSDQATSTQVVGANGPSVATIDGYPLSGHIDWVNSVAFSPDGKTLA